MKAFVVELLTRARDDQETLAVGMPINGAFLPLTEILPPHAQKHSRQRPGAPRSVLLAVGHSRSSAPGRFMHLAALTASYRFRPTRWSARNPRPQAREVGAPSTAPKPCLGVVGGTPPFFADGDPAARRRRGGSVISLECRQVKRCEPASGRDSTRCRTASIHYHYHRRLQRFGKHRCGIGSAREICVRIQIHRLTPSSRGVS